MTGLGWAGCVLIAMPALCLVYAYALYPLMLRMLVPRAVAVDEQMPADWPSITIVLPVFNAASSIARTLEGVLAFDYPADRRQILVVSDGSTDGTDDVVAQFRERGVELLRQVERQGKTAAENAAVALSRGEIVVQLDATVMVPPHALRPLIAAFADPSVGVASGRDVSVQADSGEATAGEGGYVGMEMALRALETRLGSIVGASGCFFAVRRSLQDADFPTELSKDFAAPLRARRQGFRSVSVERAICYVPRTAVIDREYGRKVRTMARGLQTLWHERDLLNPVQYGTFAWMLWSHKLLRWFIFLFMPLAALGAVFVAIDLPFMRPLVALSAALVGAGWIASRHSERLPRSVALLAFAVAAAVAGMAAWRQALSGRGQAIWEPTRRELVA